MLWFRRGPRLRSQIRDLELLPTLQSAWYPPRPRRLRRGPVALVVFLLGLGGGVAVERVILAAPDRESARVVVLPGPDGSQPVDGGTSAPQTQLAASTGTATATPTAVMNEVVNGTQDPAGTAGGTGAGPLPGETTSVPVASGGTPSITSVPSSVPSRRRPPTPAPSPSTPSPAPAPSPSTPTPSPSPPAPDLCTSRYAFSSTWNGGFVVNLVLTNTSTSAWADWSGAFSMSPTAAVVNSWGGTLTVRGTAVLLAPAPYDTWVPPGQSVTIGFQGATMTGAPTLSGFRVAGNACRPT